MIPHHCRIKHDPPNSYGDCLRAVIASMFEVADPLEVPHFLHDGDDEAGQARFKAYLLSRGYRPYYQAIKCDNVQNLFVMMREINTNIEYLLFCTCGGGDHVVLCMNDHVIHDPAWVKGTITGPPSNMDGCFIIVTLVGGP